jgi:hypothetical protein
LALPQNHLRFGGIYREVERDVALAPILLHAVTPEGDMNVETVTARVRAEFEEMPGMTLTVPQASRLFGLDDEVCLRIVEQLVKASYLRWTHTGAVTRIAG